MVSDSGKMTINWNNTGNYLNIEDEIMYQVLHRSHNIFLYWQGIHIS